MEFLKTDQFWKNRHKQGSFAMLMMLSITFSMVMGMQIAGAHHGRLIHIPIVVAPDIIGVNQNSYRILAKCCTTDGKWCLWR